MGLNISQPPDLLHLYRDFYNRVSPERNLVDAGSQTEEGGVLVEQLRATVAQLELELENVRKDMVREWAGNL